MSAADVTLQAVLSLIGRSSKEATYLYGSFLRRNARKFRAISEAGTLYSRVSVTVALALICVIASYLVVQLDPFNGFEGLMSAPHRAVWAALVPFIAVPPMYWLLRRHSSEPILFTFLNLGLVTSALIMVAPTVVAVGGIEVSGMSQDLRQFRIGRGAGTQFHDIYCGRLETAAELQALWRAEDRALTIIHENMRALEDHRRGTLATRDAAAAAARRLRDAGGPASATDPLAVSFMDTMRESVQVLRQEAEMTRHLTAQMQDHLSLVERSIDLQNELTVAPWRIFPAYPVATAFVIVGVLLGILIHVFAAVITWILVVKPQPSRGKRIFAGASVVVLFSALWVGFGLLRSGVLEALIVEPPSQEQLAARLRSEFEAARPLCRSLDNHGLW